MLPPPGTIASCTPESTTPRTAAAIATTRSGSVPYSRSPISASPESFRRTRENTGPGMSGLFADHEARETPDHDVLAGRRGDLVRELADRLAVVLVGVDVGLVEQHRLRVPLRELALGD